MSTYTADCSAWNHVHCPLRPRSIARCRLGCARRPFLAENGLTIWHFLLRELFYFFRLSTMEFTEYGDWPWRARNSHSLQAIRVEPLLVSFVAIVRRAPPAAHTYGATSLGLG